MSKTKRLMLLLLFFSFAHFFKLTATSPRVWSKHYIVDAFFPEVKNYKTISFFQDTLNTNTQQRTKRKKLIAGIAAFPVPFGFMGAHRVMLGCKPWIPLVYVATFGGCFGVLPLIDFGVITFTKKLEKYENNPHIFMWIDKDEEE